MSNKQRGKGKKGGKGNNKPQDNPITREEEEPQQPVLQQPATQEENAQHQTQEKPEAQETRPEEPKVEIQADKPPSGEQTPSQTLASESIEVSATSELAQSSQSEPQVATVQHQVTSSEVAAETKEEQAVVSEAAQVVQEQVQAKVEESIPVTQQQEQKHQEKQEVHNVPTHTTEFEVLTESTEAAVQPFKREEENIKPADVKEEASKPEAELVVHNQPQQELPKEETAHQQQQAEVPQKLHEVVAQQPVVVQPETKIEVPVEVVPEPAEQPVVVQANEPQAQPQAEQNQPVVHEEVVTKVVEVEPPREYEAEIQREPEVPQQPEAVEAPPAHQEVEQPQPESKPAPVEPVEPVVPKQEVKYEETVINMNQPIDEVFFPKEEPKTPVQQPKEEERLFRLVESQQITQVVVAESIEIPRVQEEPVHEEVKIVVGDSLSFSDLNYSIEVGASQEHAEPSHKSSEQPLDPIQQSNSALVEQAQEQEASVEQLVVSQPEPIKIEESSPNESILASQPVEILEEKVEEKAEEAVERSEEVKEAETKVEEVVEKHEEVKEKEDEPEFVRSGPMFPEEKQDSCIDEPRKAEPEAVPSSENLGIDSNIAQPVPEREVVMVESVVEQFQKEEVERLHEAPVPAPKVVGLFLGEDPKQAKQQEKPKPSLLKKFLLPSAVGVAAGSALWLLRGKETGSSIAVGLAASALTYLCS